MNTQMRDALRQLEDKAASIEALWLSVPPQIHMPDGTRLPDEIRELASISRVLVGIVASQQEEIMALKERLGS